MPIKPIKGHKIQLSKRLRKEATVWGRLWDQWLMFKQAAQRARSAYSPCHETW